MSEPPREADPAPRGTSFINRVVAASLEQRLLAILLTIILIGVGLRALHRLPVDAYPDLSPPMVEIITQWPGHAAEEVERLITVPVEIGMTGIPKAKFVRSVSLYGLSQIDITLDGAADRDFSRQEAFNRLGDIDLPTGVTPSISPLTSPSGLIYRYTLRSPDRSPMELKTFEDWVVEPQYKSVAGVADDSGFGGGEMQYQVLLDQNRVAAAGLSPQQVESALAANNGNAGGGFYNQGGEFNYVRSSGRIETLEDIGNVVAAVHGGVPVLVKDLGRVTIGIAPRLGEFGIGPQDDAVEGVVLLRTGEKTQDVLRGVEAKTRELNAQILPRDIKVVPFYDRTDLVAVTTKVVEDNLLRGMLLVVAVLIFFLYDVRAGLIVAVTIPLALLFAFTCLDLQHASANLLSIGAIDFGILVESAVVMVENIYRQLGLRQGSGASVTEIICDAAAEVARPLFYAVAVIVVSFLPIYVLTGPSGTLFRPMADTMIFSLIGSLIVTLTLLPILCAWLMRRGVTERRNKIFEAIRSSYHRALDRCFASPRWTVIAAVILFGCALLLTPRIGGEFMPHLDEGALWVRATMPYTISFDESARIVPKVRAILSSFPEVTVVASEHGRPDDGTDATGFFNAEFYVGLKPYSEWHTYRTKGALIEAINRKLQAFPGIDFNYTQPAEDAVDEAETGLKSALAVKIFGPDLDTLQQKGKAIKQVLAGVRGIDNVTVVQELGQPSLSIRIDRAKIARYGLNVDDVNSLITTAIGGDVATQIVQQEKQFDLLVRLDRKYRDDPVAIGNILVQTPDGQHIPLKEFADISVIKGASFIYRENNSRFIGVQFSVDGRDLAGAVQDAMQQVSAKVPLPQGYHYDWGGEYGEYTASRAQLSVIVPLTLFFIFILLFILYKNFKFPFITVVGVLLSAPVGGILGLWITGTAFSVSSAIGFLALFGVSVQTAIVYISYVNELRLAGMPLTEAIHEGALLRLRPIMMTALVAALGLLPAALATGVGTDTQRPFAIVIVFGLLARLLISIFLMPALYALIARPDDRLEV